MKTEKHILSISLGSTSRDHETTVTWLGQRLRLQRRAASFGEARRLFREMDGVVDVFGIGGTDLYLTGPSERFKLPQAWRLVDGVTKTPFVDGTGVKNILEPRVIRLLDERKIFPMAGRRVFMVCGMDRFGMAQALVEAGGKITCGDLMLTLKIDEPITDLATLEDRARTLMPEIAKMPLGTLYRIGTKQDEPPDVAYARYFDEADIIAGDFHFIKGFAPLDLAGKVIITNTVTAADVADLRRRGVSTLVTTTPECDGRSFGTNVIEAALVALLDRPFDQIVPEHDYPPLIERLDLQPRVLYFNA